MLYGISSRRSLDLPAVGLGPQSRLRSSQVPPTTPVMTLPFEVGCALLSSPHLGNHWGSMRGSCSLADFTGSVLNSVYRKHTLGYHILLRDYSPCQSARSFSPSHKRHRHYRITMRPFIMPATQRTQPGTLSKHTLTCRAMSLKQHCRSAVLRCLSLSAYQSS